MENPRYPLQRPHVFPFGQQFHQRPGCNRLDRQPGRQAGNAQPRGVLGPAVSLQIALGSTDNEIDRKQLASHQPQGWGVGDSDTDVDPFGDEVQCPSFEMRTKAIKSSAHFCVFSRCEYLAAAIFRITDTPLLHSPANVDWPSTNSTGQSSPSTTPLDPSRSVTTPCGAACACRHTHCRRKVICFMEISADRIQAVCQSQEVFFRISLEPLKEETIGNIYVRHFSQMIIFVIRCELSFVPNRKAPKIISTGSH